MQKDGIKIHVEHQVIIRLFLILEMSFMSGDMIKMAKGALYI